MYKYLFSVLRNHFNPATECTTDETIAFLKESLRNNPDFSKGLRVDVENALSDQFFSWKDTFIEHECELLYMDDETEEEVRSYARKIFWDALFS